MRTLVKRNKTWISSAHRGFVKEGIAPNSLAAFKRFPDMAEYLHTSNFAEIDRKILNSGELF